MSVADEIVEAVVDPLKRMQILMEDEAGKGMASWFMAMGNARNQLTDGMWGEGAAEILERLQRKYPELTFEEVLEHV